MSKSIGSAPGRRGARAKPAGRWEGRLGAYRLLPAGRFAAKMQAALLNGPARRLFHFGGGPIRLLPFRSLKTGKLSCEGQAVALSKPSDLMRTEQARVEKSGY